MRPSARLSGGRPLRASAGVAATIRLTRLHGGVIGVLVPVLYAGVAIRDAPALLGIVLPIAVVDRVTVRRPVVDENVVVIDIDIDKKN